MHFKGGESFNCPDVFGLLYLHATGPPILINPPENYQAVEGDNATFDCGAYGTPFPETGWIFQGSELEVGSKYTIEQEGVNFGRLTIHNVTFSDSGEYTCNISNPIRTLLVPAQLLVQGLLALQPT